MLWTLLLVAHAGYGDAVDGYPSPAERELHLWTNAVRVDPQAFNANYMQGGCQFAGFKSGEKLPKPPLAWNQRLNDAARFHSKDMDKFNFLSHDSSDGTSFERRLSRFYSGYAIGENVAYGYVTPYDTVMQGWMCSSGHRANIMHDGFDEFGGGVSSDYMTQDFGLRNIDMPHMTAGISRPAEPTNGSATFLVDVNGVTPIAVYVAIDGAPSPMELRWGVEDQGVYGVDAEFSPGGCHAFWFELEGVDGISRFPEEGAYGFGDCKFDDPDAKWFSGATLRAKGGALEGITDGTVSDGDVPGGAGPAGGCAVVSANAAGWGASGLGAAMALLARRRRRG